MDTNTAEEWIPLSITHVLYPKDDTTGQLLALLSLTPFGIVVAFITLSLFVRDIHVIFFFCGQLLNEVLCLVLKRLFRQSRPIQVVNQKYHSNRSYGMPSQHSQFMAFFTFYCLLFFIFRLKRKSNKFKSLLVFAITLLFIFVVYSRIYLLYHYWSQCFAGIAIGLLFAIIWFSIINYVFEPNIFVFILKMKISRFIGLTNVYIEPKRSHNKEIIKKKK
ncbi:dolichyldiphosphatase 1-like [Oppia nitens]|uniref:dolichyldiphosphatase 1-like n=1 Tax=Oppia nitens TaxID=1686743 RepID=UPI0023DC2418|nr:dolichyldiphosphatase 1-like [Oppia nitens]